MSNLTREKLGQAVPLVRAAGLDAWVTFVRETAEGGDPILPFLLEGGLTWQSALIVTQEGKKVAIVGNFDADPLVASGDWDEVVPYVQGIRDPLVETLDRLIEKSPTEGSIGAQALAHPVSAGGVERYPRIGVNFSEDNVKADGLSHGMFSLLNRYLAGTRFEGCLVSAEPVVSALRARKSPREIEAIRAAIVEGDLIFDWVDQNVKIGMSEREIFEAIQRIIDAKGLGYGWDRHGNPIVNSGPDSMIGHGIPSDSVKVSPGHIFHIDLGVIKDGYSSDIQSCWYVPHPGETDVPEDVLHATEAVVGAISAGAAALRPGVEGWEVDAAARSFLVSKGYPEYMHAFGHQVGRMAHDGGAVLGPKWERYGRTVTTPIEENEVYTLELGVVVKGRGYLGIEEIAAVRSSGIEWLSKRQLSMPLLPSVV
ncbi:MAG TPA: M24 family metallopeptidase [Fimbriimonadaceae bacterium]|nr:M24 family metallopeptidase [Fimbriimonadaceae bacterium]